MSLLHLSPHRATACEFVREFRVHVHGQGESLRLLYEVDGDMQRLAVPEPRPSARTDGLWRHTCFEIFLRAAGDAYHEFNFSPSGEWAAYSFAAYRQGMEPLDLQPPAIHCTHSPLRLQVEVQLRTPLLARPGTRAALAAVLEDRDGAISYWALVHPAARPDFHDPAGFVARDLVRDLNPDAST